MKISGLLAGLIVLGLSFLNGAEPFVAPSFVKELKDLEKVKADAAKENKGITFLLMEPGST